jgi:hypothetical protein
VVTRLPPSSETPSISIRTSSSTGDAGFLSGGGESGLTSYLLRERACRRVSSGSEICSRRGSAALRALWSSMMLRNLGQATMASSLG